MVVNLRQRNFTIPIFLGFQCLRAIFSQLGFESCWLYLLGEVAITQKLLKMTQKYFKSHCSESP